MFFPPQRGEVVKQFEDSPAAGAQPEVLLFGRTVAIDISWNMYNWLVVQ